MGKGGGSGCPPVDSRPPYDELSHQIGKTVLSVKVPKNAGRLKNVDGTDVNSQDDESKSACAKVNVIPNTPPPKKRPEEEQLLLRTTRQILNSEEMRNILEIELKLPRNYEPMPKPPPFKILFADDENAIEECAKAQSEEKSNGKK